MPREPVESSLIRAVAYDVPSSILEVELAEDGVVYEYFDVPFSAYTELMDAESKGSYYNDFIKDLYAFRKREPEAGPAVRTGRAGVVTFGLLSTGPRPADPLTGALTAARPESAAAQGRPRRPTGLELESATYRSRLPEFLRDHEDQFVLIRGAEVLGFWPTFDEALEVGYDRFGLVPLLVKKVRAEEPVYYFSRDL